MKKSQIIISIIVVAVLIVGIALYSANKSTQNSEQPITLQPAVTSQSPEPEPVQVLPTETVTVPAFDKTDWKLYQNKDLGAEFQIPSNLTEQTVGIFRSSGKQDKYEQTVKNCGLAKNSPYGDPSNCIWWDKPNFELKFGVFSWNSDRGDPDRTRVTINGVVWLKADIHNSYKSYQNQDKHVFNYQLEKRRNENESFEFVSEDEKMLQKILSTFKQNIRI